MPAPRFLFSWQHLVLVCGENLLFGFWVNMLGTRETGQTRELRYNLNHRLSENRVARVRGPRGAGGRECVPEAEPVAVCVGCARPPPPGAIGFVSFGFVMFCLVFFMVARVCSVCFVAFVLIGFCFVALCFVSFCFLGLFGALLFAFVEFCFYMQCSAMLQRYRVLCCVCVCFRVPRIDLFCSVFDLL